jgi:hypothetical protein
MKKVNFLLLFVVAVMITNCNTENSTISKGSEVKETMPLDSIVFSTENQLLKEYLKDIENLVSNEESLKLTDFKYENIDYRHVQPILETNCYACHNPKGNAPFSLMDYETVKKKSLAIADVLKYGIMPPWRADTTYSRFINAPKMSDYEKSLVIHWTENSSTLGEKGEAPVLNTAVPSVSIPAMNTYKITSNEDAYNYTVFDPKLSKDLKVSYIDYTQSNPAVVHHRTLFIDTSGTILNKKRSQTEYESILDNLTPFTAWSKGMIPTKLTDDFHYSVPAQSKFMLQTHYQGDGNIGQTDKFSLNIYESISNGHQINFTVNNNLNILYKANEIANERVSMYVKDSISVTGIIPHMHYLVRKLECYAVVGNTKINLLKIPAWDYYFQGQYILEKPITIPAGATIYLSVVVDNTDKNAFQPNNPIRDVVYAQSSKDEMLSVVILHTQSPISEELQIAEKLFK